MTAVDISERMLEEVSKRADRANGPVELKWADAESMPFEDGTFDGDGHLRVLLGGGPGPGAPGSSTRRPAGRGGRLLGHVRPRNPVLGKLFDWLSPLTRRLFGPQINRRTEENVRKAGLDLVEVKRDGIWREIVARPRGREAQRPGKGEAMPAAPTR